jgi:hypothetical protein
MKAMAFHEPMAEADYRTTAAKPVGDQFSYTVHEPVTLDRRQSAMIPLTQGALSGRKVSIFSGQHAHGPEPSHPLLGIELTNDTGLKLPAGPISVYDGGTYAGNALLGFLPENEKRLISYGDDLSVVGTPTDSNAETQGTFRITEGTVLCSKKRLISRKYDFKNSSSTPRVLIIEHPRYHNAKLTETPNPTETTGSLYRFEVTVTAGQALSFTVTEEEIICEKLFILKSDYNTIAAWQTGLPLSDKVRAALMKAGELLQTVEETAQKATDMTASIGDVKEDQRRIRDNLTAVGPKTEQGTAYMKKLTDLDDKIDRLQAEIDDLRSLAVTQRHTFNDYVSGLEI